MLPIIMGEYRVATDPELRFAQNGGMAIAKCRIVAGSRKQVNGEWVDDKSAWFTLTLFKKLAENFVESAKKGDLVIVVGRQETDEWETEGGDKRHTDVILADMAGLSLTFNAARKIEGGQSGGGGQSEGVQRSQSAPADNPWSTAPPQEGAPQEPPF